MGKKKDSVIKANNEMVAVKNHAEQLLIERFTNDFEKFVEERKQEFSDNLVKYVSIHREEIETSYGKVPTGVIENYLCTPFIKSITKIPKYNGEKLLIASDFFWDCVSEIEANGINFIPTIQQFCRLIGITYSTFKSYKNHENEDMRNAVEMINDRFTGYYYSHFNAMGKKEYSDNMAIFTLKSVFGMNDNSQVQINKFTFNSTVPNDLVARLSAQFGYDNAKVVDNDEGSK